MLAEELYPQRKLDLDRLRSPYRDAVQRALAGRRRIEEAIASTTPDSVRESLTDSGREVVEVEQE